EGVEEGQHAHDAVAGVDPEELRDGVDVADDVVVREHDAFGDAGGSAGEDDGGEGVGRAAAGRKEGGGGEAGGEVGAQLSGGSNGLQQVFDVDGARQRLDLGVGEERARSDDGRDAALFDGGLHGVGAGGEVQVDRDRAAQGEAQVHQRAGHGGGEKDAYQCGAAWQAARRLITGATGGLATRRRVTTCPTNALAGQYAAQQHGTCEDFAVGERTAGGIGHGEFAPVAASHTDEAAIQQVAGTPAIRGGIGGELLDGLADGLRAAAGRERRAETHGHGIGYPGGPLPEEFAAGEAEDAAPHAIQMHRNDGHAAAFD